ncbi:MAG TPA: hypothetical protein VE262_12115 [Blastocatellia bacterium]|nr:hypothetical protein [Blastocatellia bacterium]
MIANSSNKSSGCGCGGTTSAALCGCGGAGCASCQGQGIVRPRFFAGQLLTEDDLQLLTNYVGHKNRLHNRHLFGAGVVCGLEVTCHPCGNGQVIVHPGYALDCCGNDLTLDCATTLDINAMVRDLRRDKLGGFDCVDPCPDPPKPKAGFNVETGARANINRENIDQEVAAPNQPKPGPQPPPLRYCLYVRYCEQQSDPVMPYSTGEDCGRQSCEATRVREGVKFELRCMPPNDSAHPLIKRLCECLGDLNKLQRTVAAAQQLNRATDLSANTLITDFKVFTDDEVVTLGQKVSSLNNVFNVSAGVPVNIPANAPVNSPANAPTSAPGVAASDVSGTDPNMGARFAITPELLQSVNQVALAVNRFEALKQEEKTRLLQSNPGFTENLRAGQEVIGRARSIAVGISRSAFAQVRDWLIERLDNAPYLSDCTLRQRVSAMVMPEFGRQPGEAGTRAVVGANRPLLEAFITYLRDCACRALNPACEPCDDTGVLLACFEVKDCAVVSICNLERTFVLSPAAVRYWLPPLRLIGNLAERLCCAPFDSLLGTVPGTFQKRFDFGDLLKQEVARILNDSLCDFRGADMLGDVMSNIDKFFRSLSGSPTRAPFAQPAEAPGATGTAQPAGAVTGGAVAPANEDSERAAVANPEARREGSEGSEGSEDSGREEKRPGRGRQPKPKPERR